MTGDGDPLGLLGANAPYYNLVDQLYHADWAARKLARLELMRETVRALWPRGHPTRLVHVAGSAGKGSVCRMIGTGLAREGPAAAYTKPHVFDHRESFTLGGAPASQEDLIDVWERTVLPACVRVARRGEEPFRYTEARLLLALAWFEHVGARWGVVETGMGGRYDETTALDVALTVLTNVGRDHASRLGHEPWQRAIDKAGILRPGVPLVLGVCDDVTRVVVRSLASRAGSALHEVGAADLDAVSRAAGPLSRHRAENAALAARALAALGRAPDAEAIRALAATRSRARFERVAPDLVLDVAHNPEKVAALCELAREEAAGRPLVFVLGLTGDRDPVETFAPVLLHASLVVVTSASFRSQDPRAVAAALAGADTRGVPIELEPDPRRALALARSKNEALGGLVVATGSAYMIDQAVNPDPFLRTLHATYGWRWRAEDTRGA